MKLSVVIPAYNEEKLLAGTLSTLAAALAPLRAAGWETETIVCDNNSTDATAEIARAHGATVVFEAINQIARARNTGARATTGDWLLFLDADSHPSPALLADVAEAVLSGKCVAGGATLALDEPHRFSSLVIGLWNLVSRIRRLAAGSFIFCERAAFSRIGGFDEELFAAEEIDFVKRLKPVGRETKRGIAILHRHPIITSNRKVNLYTPGELLWFFLKAVFLPRSTIRNREACQPWYDGRR